MTRVSRRRFLTTTGATAGVVLASTGLEAQAPVFQRVLADARLRQLRALHADRDRRRPSRRTGAAWVRGERNEMLRRATDDPAIDGGETSMAQHVQRLDRGDRSLVAIPIFPLRNFTARDLYTRKGVRIAPARWAAGASASTTGRRAAPSGTATCSGISGPTPTKVNWVVGGVDGPATGTPAGSAAAAREAVARRRFADRPLDRREMSTRLRAVAARAISIRSHGPIVRAFPASRRWSRSTLPTPAATRHST